jgi:hypothetical protein
MKKSNLRLRIKILETDKFATAVLAPGLSYRHVLGLVAAV